MCVNGEQRRRKLTLPWGTPHCSSKLSPMCELIYILAFLSSRKSHSSFSYIPGRLRCSILYFNPECHTLSKAFSMSINTTWHCPLSALHCDMASEAMARACVVPLCVRNPNWLGLYRSLVRRWYLSLLLIILSNIFPGTSKS